jgi:hypothetical protein
MRRIAMQQKQRISTLYLARLHEVNSAGNHNSILEIQNSTRRFSNYTMQSKPKEIII